MNPLDPQHKFSIFNSKDAKRAPTNLFDAAELGDAKYIHNFIENSLEFDPAMTDKFERTPLHWAAEMGHEEAASVLIEAGCEATALECNGRTAVHLAARAGNTTMLNLLLETVPEGERPAMVNKADKFGITPVFLAVQKIEQDAAPFELLMANGGKFSEEAHSQAAKMQAKIAEAEANQKKILEATELLA